MIAIRLRQLADYPTIIFTKEDLSNEESIIHKMKQIFDVEDSEQIKKKLMPKLKYTKTNMKDFDVIGDEDVFNCCFVFQ